MHIDFFCFKLSVCIIALIHLPRNTCTHTVHPHTRILHHTNTCTHTVHPHTHILHHTDTCIHTVHPHTHILHHTNTCTHHTTHTKEIKRVTVGGTQSPLLQKRLLCAKCLTSQPTNYQHGNICRHVCMFAHIPPPNMHAHTTTPHTHK